MRTQDVPILGRKQPHRPGASRLKFHDLFLPRCECSLAGKTLPGRLCPDVHTARNNDERTKARLFCSNPICLQAGIDFQ